ncbi:MAG: MFS transporter [candidate division NC10 bacterium]|uniref:MFS transporter n=1 Tax=Tectimicrobiota bacterium TaxID=2528274 RepID=A0A932HZ36_UNCTE|nr:MFS transporter [candidate division NC10 bacterium]MBI3128370.1 MFS transporter [Candidatus Tectomicrobia bacterium]
MGKDAPAQESGADLPRRRAVGFIIFIGVVSLFGDMTYEGARSITGPFLAVLGAGATAVGVVAGLGELVGYAVRLASGYLSDRTGRYWAVTIAGYAINLLAVPLLALVHHWELAAILIVSERMGKAIRTPARDAMLSHASSRIGLGWGFGLHEALDQTGAIAGPLIISAVLYFGGEYRTGFGILLVPALLALAVLLAARFSYPRPRDFELAPPPMTAEGLPKSFWIYMAGAMLIGAGFADFPLLAFHFEKAKTVPVVWIPTLYAVAMAADAIAALALGRLFDRVGIRAMILAAGLSLAAVPLAVLGGLEAAVAAMVLWGVGMGAQESVMRAAIAALAPSHRRATAYGIFNAGFGAAWFAGSALMGFLYDWSVMAMVAASVLLQAMSLPILASLGRVRFR